MSQSYSPYTRRQTMVAPDFEVYRYRSAYMNEVELHHHDFYEVYLLLRGRVEYIVENHIYRMRPGDVMLVSPLELHQARIEPDEEYERIVLWIDRGFLEQLSTPHTSLTRCFDTSVPGHLNLLRLPGAAGASLRQLLERLRVENPAEYFFAVLGGCEQQFQEIALRDHCDLRELVAVDPHDVDDCPVDVFLLRDHSPVRIAELCVRFRQGKTLAAFLRPPVFGAALHGVFLSRIRKHKLDFRRRIEVCIFRTEHVRFSAAAAGFAVKRERYRIEYGRLARAGVAGYQVKAARSELLEVEFGPAGVRSECRHHKFQRSHSCSSSPQISAASFSTSADCSSDIGALFCSS